MIGGSEKWMRLNHIMIALTKHLDSVIRKRPTSKRIDYEKNRLLDDENDVTMLLKT